MTKKSAHALLLCLLLCAGSPACDDNPKKEGGESGKGTGESRLKTCEANFVSKRHLASWYPQHDFGDAVACDKPKTKSVQETASIPIYWVRVGKNWTDSEMKEKVDAAKDWYARFCITLTLYPVTMKTSESDAAADALAAADAKGRDAYRKKINDVYGDIWNNRMGKPREFLLILFVDPFQQIKYDNVWVNVSGNLSDIPVILITSDDKSSKHIVTHELIHGLGKGIGTGSPPGADKSAGGDLDDTWNEGGCAEEMGNSARTKPSDPLNKPDDAPMDWASYWHYMKVSHAIK